MDGCKMENIVEIKDAVRIPGTDIILEKGDKIEIIEKEIIKEKK